MKAQSETILEQFTVIERAVLYARVSSDDRGKDGRNLAGQIEMGREFAEKKGYTVIEEFQEDDRGASGYEIDLPELNKIRDMAQAGQFDVLIVRELDRLSRNLAKQLIIEEELKQHGVRIEYVLAEYDDTPEGRLQKHIRATVAEYEREKIKERMVRGKELASKRGKVLINIPPLGYDLIEGQLVINETEAEIVRLIFQLYVFEQGTLYRLALQLDEMGIIRQGKSGSAQKMRNHAIGWTPSAIRKILRNETYTGTFYYGRKRIPVSVPAIIEPELWNKAQQRMEENKRIRKHRRYEYLLSGMMECGNCHNSYIAYAHNIRSDDGAKVYVYPKYACSAKHNPGNHAAKCEAPILKVEPIDIKVWDWIRGFLTDPDRLQLYLEKHNQEAEQLNAPIISQIQTTDKLIREHKIELDRLIVGYQKGIFELEDIADKKERLKTIIGKLTGQREELQARLSQEMLTDQEKEDIMSIARKTGKGVAYADKNFEARRKIVRALKTRAILTHNGEKTEVLVTCVLDTLSFDVTDTQVKAR